MEDATWQRTLARGTARIGSHPTLYVEVIETGEIAELKLSVADSLEQTGAGEHARRLRDALESILSGNASLSFDATPPA